MNERGKYSSEEKIKVVLQCLNGQNSIASVAGKLGLHPSAVQLWINKYKAMGVDGFSTKQNKKYTESEKKQAVSAYLSGEGSLMHVCRKFKIHSTTLLRSWIKQYNDFEKSKTSKIGGASVMSQVHQTTFEERVKIVSYCISHDHNYSETAEKFNVSYYQVRRYVIKYEQNGVNALQDNRGKRKPKDSLTEVEKLKAELKMEKAKRKQAEMEISFLKKLNEIERRGE